MHHAFFQITTDLMPHIEVFVSHLMRFKFWFVFQISALNKGQCTDICRLTYFLGMGAVFTAMSISSPAANTLTHIHTQWEKSTPTQNRQCMCRNMLFPDGWLPWNRLRRLHALKDTTHEWKAKGNASWFLRGSSCSLTWEGIYTFSLLKYNW